MAAQDITFLGRLGRSGNGGQTNEEVVAEPRIQPAPGNSVLQRGASTLRQSLRLRFGLSQRLISEPRTCFLINEMGITTFLMGLL